MLILPAIDMYEGKAVRLFQGDYDQMTVYDDNPVRTARKFRSAGAEWVHLVDLEGARDGGTPNMGVVSRIIKETGLMAEVGGGIRNTDTVSKYMDIGVSRVIIGTGAITNERFLVESVQRYGDRIAVAADVRDGYVAIKGWTEKSERTLHDFCKNMQDIGVRTLICTDISKDGAMQGTNLEMYHDMVSEFDMDLIASGGISTIDDVKALSGIGMHGAIIGKAYYTGALDLAEAIEAAR